MPKLDLTAIPQTNRTGYPEPFSRDVAGRWFRLLGPAGGMTTLGASHVVLKPGAWSAQRHWHAGEDEILVLLSGEAVLIDDDGRTPLCPGDICVWPAGSENGHHIVNESTGDCSFLVVSGGEDTGGSYPDIDMMWTADQVYRHKDGSPY